MQYFPPALEKLTEQFARLPGIGNKSAQRLAFFVLSLPDEDAQAFADAIVTAKRAISLCPVCQNLTEGEGPCAICRSDKRDGGTVCVVADPKDVIAMERSREYQGRYHVLHGVISPMNHVGPDAGGHHGHQPGHGGGGHGHVSGPSPAALWREDHPAGLWGPGGRPPGVCRRRHADAGAGRAERDVKHGGASD